MRPRASIDTPTMRRLGRDIGGVRPAVAHRHPEALGRADGDVGPELARRNKKRERQRIGRHDRERSGCVQAGNGRPKIPDFAAAAGVLKERAEHRARSKIGQRIADNDLPAEWLRPRAQHGNGLRVTVAVDEESRGGDTRDPARHRHGFGGGGRLVEERCVGDLEACEIDDHGLEIQQGFEPALADLRLVRRIGGVPGRILEDVASDHRRQEGAVIALADERGHDLVSGCNRANLRQRLRLGQRRTEIERDAPPDCARHRLLDQLVDAGSADDSEHLRHVGRRGTDVAAGKLVVSERIQKRGTWRHRMNLFHVAR